MKQRKEKGVVFDATSVQAIMAGRKTVFRMAVRQKYDNTVLEMKTDKYGTRLIEIEQDIEGVTFGKREDGRTWRKIRGYIEPEPPYRRGDVLYVKEAWKVLAFWGGETPGCKVSYRAGGEDKNCPYITRLSAKNPGWHPALQMPKEAARIWVLVTDVRVEKLHDMTDEDALMEGAEGVPCDCLKIGRPYNGCPDCMNTGWQEPPLLDFMYGWDSKVKKNEEQKKGWEANPWVWVFTFKVIDPDKTRKGGKNNGRD